MRVVCGYSAAIEELTQGRSLPGRSDETLCYGVEDAAAFKWDLAEQSYAELAAQFPAGWKPDVLFCPSLEYNPVPEGIEEADCVTVGVLGDWNLGGQALHLVGGAFDLLVADRNGCERLRALGFQNVVYGPLWSYVPALHRRLPNVERDLDIVMIGNFNHEIQRERARWLARVAKLSRKYRVCLTSGVFGEDYVRLINRAKIVFNRSIRGEINMRAYEAPACGALMFYERENPEIRDLFTDREECVLYGDDDLETLLDDYLTHNEERERIAQAGHKKVQFHTWSHNSARILDTVEAALPFLVPSPSKGERVEEERFQSVRSNRSFPALSAAERGYRRALQWMLLPQRNLPRIDAELRRAERDLPNRPEILHARACFLADSNLPAPALEIFQRVLQIAPDYAAARFNLAHLYIALKNLPAAAKELKQVVALLQSPDVNAEQLRFPYPIRYDAFRTELEMIWATHAPLSDPWISAMRDLLLRRAQELLSDFAYNAADFITAQMRAERAVALRPADGLANRRLARACAALNQFDAAERAFQLALKDAPLFSQLWTEYAELLLKSGKLALCRAFLSEIEALLNGSPIYESYRPTLRVLLTTLSAAASRPLRLLALPDWNRPDDWRPLLRGYVQTFAPAEPVSLLLPLHPGRHPQVETVVAELERFFTEEFGVSSDAVPDITLLTEPPTADADLYAQADALIQPDNAESADAPLVILTLSRLSDARILLDARKAA